jgi:hypothetical protein
LNTSKPLDIKPLYDTTGNIVGYVTPDIRKISEVNPEYKLTYGWPEKELKIGFKSDFMDNWTGMTEALLKKEHFKNGLPELFFSNLSRWSDDDLNHCLKKITESISKAAPVKKHPNFWQYCKESAPFFFFDSKPYLKKICDTIQLATEGKLISNSGIIYKRIIIALPPQTGKTLLHRLFNEWYELKNSPSDLLNFYNPGSLKNRLNFTNEVLIDPNGPGGFNTKYCRGLNGVRPYKLIFTGDLIQNKLDCYYVDRNYSFYTDGLLSKLAPDGIEIIICSLWDKEEIPIKCRDSKTYVLSFSIDSLKDEVREFTEKYIKKMKDIMPSDLFELQFRQRIHIDII